MADSSSPGEATDIREYEESDEETRAKVRAVAELMKGVAKGKTIFFTGAGISTAAGLADFRGPQGIWTLALQEEQQPEPPESRLPRSALQLEKKIPTQAHMAIVSLVSTGFVSGVLSQNIDGLHMKSGLSHYQGSSSPSSDTPSIDTPKQTNGKVLVELHGNCFIEECWNCELEYIREYDTCDDSQAFAGRCSECLARGKKMCHCTPRRCLQCGKQLKDTLINFGELLNPQILASAWELTRSAHLMISLGTSMHVVPASDLARFLSSPSSPSESSSSSSSESSSSSSFESPSVSSSSRLVVVNKQKTSFDDLCIIRSFSDTNVFLSLLAEALEVEVKEYTPECSKLVTNFDPLTLARCCLKSEDRSHHWEESTPATCSVCTGTTAIWCSLCEQCSLCAQI